MDVNLAGAAFLAREGLAALTGALGGASGEARFVGGVVRDTLLGLGVADIDLATVHPPEEAMRRLKAAGIRCVPTGLAHGTITAVLSSGPVEVTTLRRDVATDGRHAVVAFADDWREDAARRDFTINALYADADGGTVHDFHGGIADLAAGRVRFIGDPYRRIAEDHLRILRFFRFQARFGDVPDPAALTACTARANDLMALSRERIAAELLKLLVARGAVATLATMVEGGILRAVLPEIDRAGADRLAMLSTAEAAAGIDPDGVRRLAALIPPDAAEAIGARLKLSNRQRRRLIDASAGVGTEGPHALAYRAGTEGAVDRLLLAGADPSEIVGWEAPRLPVSGGELVARGLRQGPVVAATLKAIETRWIAAGFPDAAATAALVDAAVAQASEGSIIAQAASESSGRA